MPASFVDGRYLVERKLGEGGKGIVFLCQDTTLGRKVAIKLIKEEVMDPDSLARFQREVQAMGQLVHPNVVTIHDVGQEGGRHFLVLELMEGGDVEHLIQGSPDGRLDTATAVRVGSDMARGLAHAHSNGILHRDIKPGNAWLTGDGVAKLGDFGLAYLGGGTRLTRAGMMVGTVAYMAPEVALGRTADERSDLYMLGASLYEMVTGRVPFQGDDPVRVIFSHINDMPLSPRRLAPDLPPALETLITRLLSKDPEQRPENAAAVLDALESIDVGAIHELPLRGTPSEAVQPTTPEPRWAQPVVGREREVAALRARVDSAMQGQGGLVFITGEAGIGKTRLAAELRAYARGRGCQWLEGRYDKDASIANQPFVEALRMYLRAAPQGALTTLVGPYATELSRVFPDVAAALGTQPQAPDVAEDDPQAARQRQQEAVAHLFTSIAKQQPLVLFLDDLQWAPSIDTVHIIARETASEPLLVVGAYRETELEERQNPARTVLAMNRERLFQPLSLGRLGHDDVAQMVSQALGQATTQKLTDLVYDRTEGNPFFVEELVRHLVESDALTMGDEGWDVRETPSLQMPRSVKVVVEERLERLSEETRRVLAMASVIGGEFALDLLHRVTETEEEALLDAVEEALTARVVVPRPGVGQETYAFADNQVRDVLYEGISPIRQRRYHLRVGEAIEKVHERRPSTGLRTGLEEYYGALAYHFVEGNDVEKAVDYSIKAGDRDHHNYSLPRARSHYQVAAELLDELGEETERAAHVHAQLGMNLVSGYGAADVGTEAPQRDAHHMERAIKLFQAAGNRPRAATLLRALGSAYIAGIGVPLDGQRAVELYREGAELLAGEPDSVDKAVAHDGLAFAHIISLEPAPAEEAAREALRIADAVGDADTLLLATTDVASSLLLAGRLREALYYRERSWEAVQKARSPWYRERAVAHAIYVGWLGDLDYYMRWYGRFQALQERGVGRRYRESVAGQMAAVHLQAGDPAAARPFLAAAANLRPYANQQERYGWVLAMLGDWDAAETAFVPPGVEEPRLTGLRTVYRAWYHALLLVRQGDYERAVHLLRPWWEQCREKGAITLELNLLPLLCEAYVRLGQLDEAHSCLARAQEILASQDEWLGLPAAVYHAEGVVASAEERWDEAEAAFQRAADESEAHGLLYDQAQALYEWAVMYLDRASAHGEPVEPNEQRQEAPPGDPSTSSGRAATSDRERGAELLDRSLEIFTRCEAKKDIEKIIARKEVLTA